MPAADTLHDSHLQPSQQPPMSQGVPVGFWLLGSLGVGGPPALRPAWRLACSLGVHQLCRELESPSSSAKGVGPVGQRPGLGDERGGTLAWPPIWE